MLKSLAKRPEDRFQTGDDFDEALSKVADRLTPGWRKGLEPGADLSTMMPGTSPGEGSQPMPHLQPQGEPGLQDAAPAAAAHSPAPPARNPETRAASKGCLGVMLALAGALSLAGLLAATLSRC